MSDNETTHESVEHASGRDHQGQMVYLVNTENDRRKPSVARLGAGYSGLVGRVANDRELLSYLELTPSAGFPAALSHGEFDFSQLFAGTALHGAASFSLELVK